MTESEAIISLQKDKEMLMVDLGVPEYLLIEIDMAKDALEEIQQYRALGTAEELREAMEKQKWIPCSEKFPPQPKENPVFENKPIELYLVDCGVEYPFRAFWNGKFFTDGFSKVEVIAWQPLPKPYKPA